MAKFSIKKGKDIKLKGAANKQIVDLALPKQAAIQPPDFRGLKLRLITKEGAGVKIGTPVLSDKTNPEIKIASPVSGKIVAVNRGEKRAFLEVVIESDGKQEAESFKQYNEGDIGRLSREQVIQALLDGGLWPVLRQRPFSKIASPKDKPKSIFIHAMNTEPLALDVDTVLMAKEREFQAGLDILKKLTDGPVNLCVKAGSSSKALTASKNVNIHQFSGAHPAGNVGTHIHYVDPINKGEVVWFVEAQDVLRVARLFLEGKYSAERVVAITGEGAKNRLYVRSIIGAPMSLFLQGSDLDGMRCISGSVLNGRSVGPNGFLCFYDSQITVIPEGGHRDLLGWLSPGFNKYTFSSAYASSFLPKSEASLDTDTNGSHRAIVLNNIYDDFNALDVMTYFLLKAIVSGNVDESERLGILECDEEDFALCTFACPSKTDVGEIIRKGLDIIEKEG